MLTIFITFDKVENVTWKKCRNLSIKKIKNSIDNIIKICYINNAAWKKQQCSLKTKQNVNYIWQSGKTKIKILLRVWSWLRMNAGGMPKTCKSNEVVQWRWSACTKSDLGCHLVAKGWVTRRLSTFKTGITIRNDC